MNTSVSQKLPCFFASYFSPNTYTYFLKVGELTSKRHHIVALLLELIFCDIMKPVAYGGEPPHFIFTLLLTLTYAFELKWGPKCQYMLKELNAKKKRKSSPLFTPVACSFEGEWLIGLLKSRACLFYLYCLIESYEKNGN